MRRVPFLLIVVFSLLGSCKNSSQGSITMVGISEVILYQHEGVFDGMHGGRSGVNGICSSSGIKPAGKTSYIGFISIDTNDTIGNLPMNNSFPGDIIIKSKTGQIVANGWSSLMSTGINDTLSNLGVMNISEKWWSGGKNGGSPTTNTCVGFNDNSSNTGMQGDSDSIPGWVETGTIACSTTGNRILCLAF